MFSLNILFSLLQNIEVLYRCLFLKLSYFIFQIFEGQLKLLIQVQSLNKIQNTYF